MRISEGAKSASSQDFGRFRPCVRSPLRAKVEMARKGEKWMRYRTHSKVLQTNTNVRFRNTQKRTGEPENACEERLPARLSMLRNHLSMIAEMCLFPCSDARKSCFRLFPLTRSQSPLVSDPDYLANRRPGFSVPTRRLSPGVPSLLDCSRLLKQRPCQNSWESAASGESAES